MQPRLIIRRTVEVSSRKCSKMAHSSENDGADDRATNSIGPCDVTSKQDLEKLIKELSSREKHLNLLSKYFPPFTS